MPTKRGLVAQPEESRTRKAEGSTPGSKEKVARLEGQGALDPKGSIPAKTPGHHARCKCSICVGGK